MTTDTEDWWKLNLAEYIADGRIDAAKGIYDLPHAYAEGDPQYEDENAAYREGWWKRRKELGGKFKWAHER